MRRLVVFPVLGPLLGLAISSGLVLPVALFLEGAKWESKYIWLTLVSLPWAYLLGIVPAAITGVFDYFLKRIRFHVFWTFIAGAVVTSPILLAYAPFSGSSNLVVAILVGGLPAAACAWLSREKAQTRSST